MRKNRRLVSGGFIVLTVVFFCSMKPAIARGGMSCGQPGSALSHAHAALQCTQCHTSDCEAAPAKCESCHSAITELRHRGQGVHGAASFKAQPCARCHGEHRGPEADILGWKGVGGKEGFDHSLTRFPLTGKHGAYQDCKLCHSAEAGATRVSFVKDTKPCASCHGDIHDGQLGRDCLRCHSTQGWTLAAFDHARQTSFPLVGKHRLVADQGKCTSCHSVKEWPRHLKPVPTSCGAASCHKRDDKHRGSKGSDCSGCHEATGFETARKVLSGHDITPQRLGGAHDRLPCRTCHNAGQKLRGQGDMCISCHQKDDIHHNSLGPRCADCHTQQTFAGARFRHDTVGCTLRGVHRVLPCVDCHKGGNYTGVAPFCVNCHRDDAMRAAGAKILPELHVVQTACTNCHNTQSFRMGSGTRQSPPESVCQ